MSRSAEHDGRNAALRQMFATTQLARDASQPTGATVPAECEKLNLPWAVEDIADSEGGKLHWLGDRKAENVLLYFHGGGFGLGAFPGHVQFLASCMEKVPGKLVVAFLEYGLTPATKYPIQYLQAVQALRHVISSGYSPSNIMTGGDSAGGNMSLAVLSHLNHPHPSIPKLDLTTPLNGTVLICPWVTFSTAWPSFKTNHDSDISTGPALLEWARDYISPADHNNYSEPAIANAEWWKGAQTQNILNVYGEWEVLRDPDVAIGKTLAAAGVNVQSKECAKQIHIDCILDSQTGLPHGPMSEYIWEWLKERC